MALTDQVESLYQRLTHLGNAIETLGSQPMDRRAFLLGGLGVILAAGCGRETKKTEIEKKVEGEKEEEVKNKKIDYSKVPVPKIGYQPLVEEPDFSQIDLRGSWLPEGRIERAMRWRDITYAVEYRYGIPKDYLLGMICVESKGLSIKPNEEGDGGVGLIHMQPRMAKAYGLETITDSNKLIDREQGQAIKDAIELHNGDLRKLIEIDERFHPIKNIDAAARFLCDLRQQTETWQGALEKFSGRRNYDSDIMDYVQKVQDGKYVERVALEFNWRNRKIRIDGKEVPFHRFVTLAKSTNRNYGLDEYKKLPGIHL